jgi:hypothetical protein
LIGCISTREDENTLVRVIDLSEYGHFFLIFSIFNNSSLRVTLCCKNYFVVRMPMLDVDDDDDGPQSFLCFCMIRNFVDQLLGHVSIVDTRRMTKTVPSSPWRYLCYECILSSLSHPHPHTIDMHVENTRYVLIRVCFSLSFSTSS